MTRPTKAVPMCCLTLNYTDYLMPADKGMKVVALMQSAVACTEEYEAGGLAYRVVDEQRAVEFKLVDAARIRMPKQPEAPRRIGHEPLKLGMKAGS